MMGVYVQWICMYFGVVCTIELLYHMDVCIMG